MKRLIGIANEGLQDYGRKVPEWGKEFNKVENIHAGLNSASAANKFLQQHANLKSYVKNPVIKSALFGGFLFPQKVVPAAGAAVLAGTVGVGVREGVKFGELLYNSKEAQKYYFNALRAAATNNISAFTRNIKQLDKTASQSGEGAIEVLSLPKEY
jgi:hypothetical protein